MRISYWRSDVCSSDLLGRGQHGHTGIRQQHVGLRSIRSSLPILMYQRTSQRGEVSMYDQFYGLSGRPFQLTPDPHFYFESATHRKAMSYLGYGLAQGDGFIVITGDIGAGKTTLVGHLMATVDPARLTAVKVVSTQVEGDDMLRLTAQAFGVPAEGADKAVLLGRIESFQIGRAQV